MVEALSNKVEHAYMGCSLEVVELSGSCGAEVKNIDLAALTDAEFEAIHAAFLEHHVLVFRGQNLSPEAHIAFGERFGELLIHPIIPHIENYPPILKIANRGKRKSLTEIWHSDVTFQAQPPMASALYALEVPSAGGDTMFANQHLALETLSPGMQTMLAGLQAVHSGGGLAKAARGEAAREAWELQGQLHPVVRTHPETGRKALFVSSGFVVGLADMTTQESQPILDFLCQHAISPHLTMRHKWAKGDLLLWDNRSVQHYAIHDYGDEPRNMHRITIAGDTPR